MPKLQVSAHYDWYSVAMSEAPIEHSVEDRYGDLRQRMENIHEMLPELRWHLPADLYAQLCQQVYLVGLSPTQADIAWAREVANSGSESS